MSLRDLRGFANRQLSIKLNAGYMPKFVYFSSVKFKNIKRTPSNLVSLLLNLSSSCITAFKSLTFFNNVYRHRMPFAHFFILVTYVSCALICYICNYVIFLRNKCKSLASAQHCMVHVWSLRPAEETMLGSAGMNFSAICAELVDRCIMLCMHYVLCIMQFMLLIYFVVLFDSVCNIKATNDRY